MLNGIASNHPYVFSTAVNVSMYVPLSADSLSVAMEPTHFKLLDLLTTYTPVQDSVLRYLDIGDIIALSRTTKAFSDYVGLVQRTQFNINEKLKAFVTDPKAFRSLQAKHNILISGSFAFSFMLRRPLSFCLFDGPTLMLHRLLVERGPHAEALRLFLENEGYRVIEKPIPDVGTLFSHGSASSVFGVADRRFSTQLWNVTLTKAVKPCTFTRRNILPSPRSRVRT